MRHANSNLNILKKKRNSKIVKLNNFLKPPSSYKNINSPMTTKNTNNKNILYNLLYKDTSKISLYNTKNTTNTLKNTNDISNSGAGIYSFNSKNFCNNSISIGNSLNNKEERKKIRGHINIRLNLNDKFISNYCKTSKVRQKTMNTNIIEKIKEKDSKINKLQMDLFQSQELLNILQNEKQKELSITYNSIKSLDNIKLSNDNKLAGIFTQITEKNEGILKTNYNKYEMNKYRNKTIINNINKKNKIKNIIKNNNSNNNNKFKGLMKINSLLNLEANLSKNKNKRNKKNNKTKPTNSLSGFWKNQNSINKYHTNIPKNNTKYFSSYSTNRLYKNKPPEQYESCISLTKYYCSSKKKDKKISMNQKDNKKINLTKKIDNMQMKKRNDYSPGLITFIEKCDILKQRANKILDNYINLAKYFNNLKEQK